MRDFYIFLLLCLPFSCFSQELGKPFIKNYSEKIYKARNQNWAMIQDNRGLLYFGNDRYILEYDSETWKKIRLPNRSMARCFAKDRNGRIYVGGQGTFGYLTPDSVGNMTFFSLAENLPKEHQVFNDVWAVHVMEDGIYFTTNYKLYRMTHSGEFDRFWKPLGSDFFYSSVINGNLYVQETNVGIRKLINDKFQFIRGGKQFANTIVNHIIPFVGQNILITTEKNGLFIYKPQIDNLSPLNGAVEPELKRHAVYCALKLSENQFAIGTLNNGVYVIDAQGNKLLNINQKVGLRDNQVWGLGRDHRGILWVCMNDGIAQVELNSPFTYWSKEDGLEGIKQTMIRFQNKLYVATSQNVYYYNKALNSFQGVSPAINNQCWDFHKLMDNGKERLLVGTQVGVFEIDKGKSKLIEGTKGGYKIFQPSKFPNHLFVSTFWGIDVLKNTNGNLSKIGKLKDFNEEVRQIEEGKEHQVFLGSTYRGIYLLNFTNNNPLTPEITAYDTTQGLPAMRFNYPRIVDDQQNLIFSSTQGLFKFDYNQKKFEPYERLGKEFAGYEDKYLWLLGKSTEEKVWHLTSSGIGYTSLKTKETNQLPFLRLTNDAYAIYEDMDKGVIWIGCAELLYCYNTNKEHLAVSQPKALIRQVTLAKDSVIFGGTFYHKNSEGTINMLVEQPKTDILTLDYASASDIITFQFATLNYTKEEKNYYKFKLKKSTKLFGEEKKSEWSKWSEKSEKEYTNLREGQYEFIVKAKTFYGIESEGTRYKFIISPPWHRTGFAYSIYGVITLFLLWIVVRLYTIRLKHANARLESIVSERTTEIKNQNTLLIEQKQALKQQKEEILTQNEELTQQKEEILAQRDFIEEQNSDLRYKNEQITDSIRYAQTIQQGILPFSERLDQKLKEYFILYRPKDIVSGDFYWFEEFNNTKYFAVADATGHGVPGGFMSMIGTSILNNILHKSTLTSPAEILTELNRLLIKIMKQEQDNSNKDGMDIGLIKWSEYDGVVNLSFSGAHIPLYYISDGEFLMVKGTNKAIGGYQTKRVFENTELTLKSGDSIILSSDGYADQNGLSLDDKPRKKIGSRRFKNLLAENTNKSIDELGIVLNEYLDNYQGNADQRDDITIAVIRL